MEFIKGKTPLVIISAPRTGSTPVLEHYCKLYGIEKSFSEPDVTGEMKKFEKYMKNNTDYAVKIHANNFSDYNPKIIETLLKSPDMHRIRIRRRNIVDQVASFYLAKVKDQWNNQGTNLLGYYINIDYSEVIVALNAIKKYNTELSNVSAEFDFEVYYEDFIMDDTINEKLTDKPKNYNILLDAIRARIEDEREYNQLLFSISDMKLKLSNTKSDIENKIRDIKNQAINLENNSSELRAKIDFLKSNLRSEFQALNDETYVLQSIVEIETNLEKVRTDVQRSVKHLMNQAVFLEDYTAKVKATVDELKNDSGSFLELQKETATLTLAASELNISLNRHV